MRKVNDGPVKPRRHSTLPAGSYKTVAVPDAHPSASNGAKHNEKVAKTRALLDDARRSYPSRMAVLDAQRDANRGGRKPLK